MTKIDKTVKKETVYIAYWVIILSVIMQAVFLILSKWNYAVLLGNILSGFAGVLNFLFMGITVQKAVMQNSDKAKMTMKLSQIYRMLFMLVVIIIGVALSCFDMWSVIIPIFFPRIAISLRPLFNKNK